MVWDDPDDMPKWIVRNEWDEQMAEFAELDDALNFAEATHELQES
jgi:hypothetical protein